MKKIFGLKFGLKEPKWDPKLDFLSFSQVWLISFFQIAYNDSLQQYLTSNTDKIHKNVFLRPNLSQNRPKLGPKLVILPFFKFGSLVSLEIA